VKGWKKVLFWIAVFLIAPWLLIILASQLGALFISPSGENVISNLEALRSWNGLKAIGLTFSAIILFYGKELSSWYIRTRMVKPKNTTDEEFTITSEKAVDTLYWLLWLVVGLNLSYIVFI